MFLTLESAQEPKIVCSVGDDSRNENPHEKNSAIHVRFSALLNLTLQDGLLRYVAPVVPIPGGHPNYALALTVPAIKGR